MAWRIVQMALEDGRARSQAYQHRVDRLRALGNAIVPQIAEIIGRAIHQGTGSIGPPNDIKSERLETGVTMLQIHRLDCVQCTTALEVELLAALVRERQLRLMGVQKPPRSAHLSTA